MTTLSLSKKLLLCSSVAALTACGGSSNTAAPAENTPPRMAADYTVHPLCELDGANVSCFVLEGSDDPDLIPITLRANGARSFEINMMKGVYDLDPGTALGVSSVTWELQDGSSINADLLAEGVYTIGATAFVDMNILALELDSGEGFEAVGTFTITDGEAELTRTLTLQVIGYDEDVSFDVDAEIDTRLRIAETQSDATFNLLAGFIDTDEEGLSISNFSITAGDSSALDASLYTYNEAEGTVTIHAASYVEDLAAGEGVDYILSYEVSDHTHTIARDITINTTKAKVVPEAPQIVSDYAFVGTTNSAPAVIDLSGSAYVEDLNFDDIFVDLSSIVPADGSPAVLFSKSYDNTVVVDPLDFYPHIADDAAEPTTFTYNYSLSDNTTQENGDPMPAVDATFTVTLTKEAPVGNLISNSDFESGTDGWSVTGDVGTIEASATNFISGSLSLAPTDAPTVTTSISAFEQASYSVNLFDRIIGAYVGYAINVPVGLENERRAITEHPINGVDDYLNPLQHGISFTSQETGLQPINIEMRAAIIDDVIAQRISTDLSNNIVYQTNPLGFGFEGSASDFATGSYDANDDGVPDLDVDENGIHDLDSNGNNIVDGSEILASGWVVTNSGTEEKANAKIIYKSDELDPDSDYYIDAEDSPCPCVISGESSLYIAGDNTMTFDLPAGTLEHDKEYVLRMKVRPLKTVAADNGADPMTVTIARSDINAVYSYEVPAGRGFETVEVDDPITTFGFPSLVETEPRGRLFLLSKEKGEVDINHPDYDAALTDEENTNEEGRIVTFEHYIDMDGFPVEGREEFTENWTDYPTQIRIIPSVWNTTGEYVFDDFEIYEVYK